MVAAEQVLFLIAGCATTKLNKSQLTVIFVLLAMSSLSVLLCLSLCMLYR